MGTQGGAERPLFNMRTRTLRRKKLHLIVKHTLRCLARRGVPDWDTLLHLKSGEMHYWKGGCYVESAALPGEGIVVMPDGTHFIFDRGKAAHVYERQHGRWRDLDVLDAYENGCLCDESPALQKLLAKKPNEHRG